MTIYNIQISHIYRTNKGLRLCDDAGKKEFTQFNCINENIVTESTGKSCYIHNQTRTFYLWCCNVTFCTNVGVSCLMYNC